MHGFADQIKMNRHVTSSRASLSSPLGSRLLQTWPYLSKSTFDEPTAILVNGIVVEAEVAEDHDTQRY